MEGNDCGEKWLIRLWSLSMVCLLLLCQSTTAFQTKCHREPKNTLTPKRFGDGGFHIDISGSPEKYVPGEAYTVSLQGRRSHSHDMAEKFTGFMLVVEPSHVEDQRMMPRSVGSFRLYGDVLTKHSEECPNAVIDTSSIDKSRIQVQWRAPPSGSGCLKFKATVSKQRDVWYMDDADLTKELCEEVHQVDGDVSHEVNDCCACDEAKYEVTFEGLWSRQTHPKDFPANKWLTHFSDIIGASHSKEYRVWEQGKAASNGMKHVAEYGATKILEGELKDQSDHIRTIIKARGLWYPNLNGKTFAVFRVDNRHHLMSLASMLGPSPDWFVGVSALELCLKNCSWVPQRTLKLYPYDAGTDSGISYLSSPADTIPRQTIRRITNSYPNNANNPFYDPKGLPMKPVAKLTVTRQRVYEKACSLPAASDHVFDYETFEPSYDTSDVDSERPECAVSEWSEFTPCSAACGKGLRSRTRHYRIPMKADMLRCQRQLEEKEMCAGASLICDGAPRHHFGPERIVDASSVCATTEWTTWSSCSVTCGKGFIVRSRNFEDRMGRKRCSEALTETQTCVAEIPQCHHREEVLDDASCSVTQWTIWTPCSVTCGEGVRVRTRQFLLPSATEEKCNLNTMSKVTCKGERRDCTIDEAEAKEVCLQDKKEGPCRGYFQRYYYDKQRRMCMQFNYGGCRGNRNNFHNFDDCTSMCEMARDVLHGGNTSFSSSSTHTSHDPQTFLHSLSSDTLHHGNQHPFRAYHESPIDRFGGLTSESQLGPARDCQMSAWSDWTASACSVTCGSGWREIRRTIEVEPLNGGKACPKKQVKRRKCKLTRCSK